MASFNLLANAIRFLSIDAVEAAQSGHPGMPLGMADVATVLWHRYLCHNPSNPNWFNRDRFVVSNGHGSMLLYALLHLSGYDLPLEELRNFRQLHSKTPGHPEYGLTSGVETTTGPLGQGLANGVGMAIAEKQLAQQFNRLNHTIIDHYTYVLVGDGCLMEGISHEACSLAGTLKLGKLMVFYDDNGISIDGPVKPWFSDNTAQRFKAYNWQVIDSVDGHNQQAISNAIAMAQADKDRPCLIICKTTIGLGSPVSGSEKSHGAPLGAKGLLDTRAFYNWEHESFVVSDAVYEAWNHQQKGQQAEDNWQEKLTAYQKAYPKLHQEFIRRVNACLPEGWTQLIQSLIDNCRENKQTLPTRKSSQICLEYLGKILPELLGGSADLTASNNTNWSGSVAINQDFSGNYLFYGVREFAMAAIMNGIALHGGNIPYGGTFLVFSDYARNAMRLTALMHKRVIYVLTHDSIGLGEDGPTHQPIEHAAMLRLTPNMEVWRPADLVETAISWQQAIENTIGPSCLLLSRQDLPALWHPVQQEQDIKKGAYIVDDLSLLATPVAILIATGSEVAIALEAAKKINQQYGQIIRVISMPCAERFAKQNRDYQQSILPDTIRKRVAIEAAASGYWYRWIGLDGKVIGLDRFGVSAKANEAYEYLEITVLTVIAAVKHLLAIDDN